MEDTPTELNIDRCENPTPAVLLDQAGPQKKATRRKARKTLAEIRGLRPGQAGIAWDRLKRVVRNHCEHPGHKPYDWRFFGNTIEFQCAEGGPVATIVRGDDEINVFMGGIHKTIRLVRLKTKGVGFEFRRHRYSATRVIIEISHEACKIATCANIRRE
jgi:hypothetical protein